MRVRLVFAISVVGLLTSCRATIPDGRFGCSADTDCPPGQSCVGDRCRAATGGEDGGGIDGGCGDGCADAPIDTVIVRFVHASAGVASVAIDTGDRTIELDYGTTSEEIALPRGARTLVATDETSTTIATSAVTITQRSVVVLVPDGAESAFVVVPDTYPMSPEDRIHIRMLHAIRNRGQLAFVYDPSMIASAPALDPRMASDPISVSRGSRPIVVVDVTPPPDVLASFSPLEVLDDSLVVLMGDAAVHPGAPFGLRAMRVGSDPVVPDAQMHVVSAVGERGMASVLYGCQLGRPGATATALRGGDVSATAPIFRIGAADDSLGIARSAGDACDAPTVTVDLGAVQPAQRYLAVLWGSAATDAGIRATLFAEPAYAVRPTGIIGLTAIHAAPVSLLSSPVDLRPAGGAPVIIEDLMLGTSQDLAVSRAIAGSVSLEVVDSMTMMVRGVFAPPAGLVDQNFFIGADDLEPATPVLRLVVVRAPYGARWTASDQASAL